MTWLPAPEEPAWAAAFALGLALVALVYAVRVLLAVAP